MKKNNTWEPLFFQDFLGFPHPFKIELYGEEMKGQVLATWQNDFGQKKRDWDDLIKNVMVIRFEKKTMGKIIYYFGEDLSLQSQEYFQSEINEESKKMKGLLFGISDSHQGELNWERNQRTLLWIEKARNLHPDVANWVGVYFKASYLLNEKSTDLILGPYLGTPSDHIRIPLSKGICGLAIKENRVVNIADVSNDSRYLACSIETKSELVIPLANNKGEVIGELDIDSHKLNGFSEKIQEDFIHFAETFSDFILDDLYHSS